MKACEHCERTAVEGERFCRNHRAKLRREMARSGYLTQVPRTKWQVAGLWELGDFPAAEELSGRIVSIF